MYPLFFTLKLYTYFMNLMDGWPSLWKEKKKWLFPLKFHKTCVNFVHLFFFWCFVHPTPKQGLRSKSFRYKNILKPFCSSRLLASPWLLCLKSVEATIGQLLVLQMRRERERQSSVQLNRFMWDVLLVAALAVAMRLHWKPLFFFFFEAPHSLSLKLKYI